MVAKNLSPTQYNQANRNARAHLSMGHQKKGEIVSIIQKVIIRPPLIYRHPVISLNTDQPKN